MAVPFLSAPSASRLTRVTCFENRSTASLHSSSQSIQKHKTVIYMSGMGRNPKGFTWVRAPVRVLVSSGPGSSKEKGGIGLTCFASSFLHPPSCHIVLICFRGAFLSTPSLWASWTSRVEKNSIHMHSLSHVSLHSSVQTSRELNNQDQASIEMSLFRSCRCFYLYTYTYEDKTLYNYTCAMSMYDTACSVAVNWSCSSTSLSHLLCFSSFLYEIAQ